jgi:hypothetical protein
VIYQHPLAYLLGIEGAALMRAFNGEYGADFTDARLAEVRDLLASAGQLGAARATGPISTADGYDAWADRYDQPGNLLVDIEQPICGPCSRTSPAFSGPAVTSSTPT